MECDICFFPYDLNTHRPKNLPCGHTICQECVQNPGLSNRCPTCRNQFAADPRSLPDNFALTQIIGNAPTTAFPKKRQLEECVSVGRKLVQKLEQLVPVAVNELNNLLHLSAVQLIELEDELLKLEDEQAVQCGWPGHCMPELVGRLRLLETQNCSVVVEEEGGASWRASTPAGDDPSLLGLLLLQLRAAGQLKRVEDCAGPTAGEPYVGPAWTIPAALTIDSSDVEQGFLKVNEILRDEDRWRHVRRIENLRGRNSERLLSVVAPYLEEVSIFEGSASLDVMEEVGKMRSLRRLDVVCNETQPGYPDLPLQLEGLEISYPSENNLRCLQRMPRLRSLSVWHYEGPEFLFPPAQHTKLTWLTVSAVHKATMLSLIRYYAPSLRELGILCSADQTDPEYTFPHLVQDLATSGLSHLRRLALQRPELGCCNRVDACLVQRRAIRDSLPTRPDVTCTHCKVDLI